MHRGLGVEAKVELFEACEKFENHCSNMTGKLKSPITANS